MFTGIIRAIGKLQSAHPRPAGREITVDLGGITGIRPGDSIAVAGVCLTVREINPATTATTPTASFDISTETLTRGRIAEWHPGDPLNLEPACTPQTPLGGHLVMGHVDGTGILRTRTDDGEFTRMEFEIPRKIGALIANKGALAIDGVSLTTNQVQDDNAHTRFSVSLVPHTLTATTLGTLQVGARVHIEADMVARYLQRLHQTGGGEP